MLGADDNFRQSGRHDSPTEELSRLLRQAPGMLTDTALVGLLLDGGAGTQRSQDVAARILRECNGLEGLLVSSSLPWRLREVGPDRVALVMASRELCRRLLEARISYREPMANPPAVARYLNVRFSIPGQEVMGALYLDTRNRWLDETEIYRGTLSRAAVEPRAVLKEALLRDAAGIILFHTHPSGDPSPSAEDLAFTRRLAQSAELIGVRLVDHLILGAQNAWTSLRERGGW